MSTPVTPDNELREKIARIRGSFYLADSDRTTMPALAWNKIVTADDFDRLLEDVTAAAERRGAERAIADVLKVLTREQEALKVTAPSVSLALVARFIRLIRALSATETEQ